MSRLLEGQVALITGGSRGLGSGVARCFSANGAIGAIVDLPEAVATSPLPAGFAALAADVSDEDQVEAAVRSAVDHFGRLDVVVANAGIVPPWRETEALDMSEWDRVMAVNVKGVAATLKHAALAMKSNGGSIIVMASINAFLSHPRQMLYTASKHAVLGIVRAAASDLSRHRIRVNGVAPGPIATDALLGRIRLRAAEGGPSEQDALHALSANTALGRLATVEEVANAALFLASTLSSGITGELLPVDAGL